MCECGFVYEHDSINIKHCCQCNRVYRWFHYHCCKCDLNSVNVNHCCKCRQCRMLLNGRMRHN